MSVARAQQEVSSREFAEWQAYDRLDPIGDERADIAAGIVASVVANTNRDERKRAEPFKPGDFMANYDGRAPAREDSRVMVEKLKMGLRAAVKSKKGKG